jgi:hypothetical protein
LSDENVTGPPGEIDLDYNPDGILQDNISQVPGKLIDVHHLALIAMSCVLGRFRNTEGFIHLGTIVGPCWATKVINYWYLNIRDESDESWHTHIEDMEVISLKPIVRRHGRPRKPFEGGGQDKEADKPQEEAEQQQVSNQKANSHTTICLTETFLVGEEVGEEGEETP